ncbi:energy-coupling factor ABC transporter substrate-binding protein [Raineyella sp. W15-4]|uniref:energy-coupling factor ABC transporter substrate-binding protein n=1 Tax=Raineyella sp. W15-4 TaxID=3081651 RepID=UPI0029545A34|nr:energy-coupling factor ABC transporter substrate-binding protein [Raineyella sp. W15-4]WOQ16812.1 energy-coupling factor ABC transporter substrate-binding protein [Raineyella sp. W15-4]
MSEFSHTVKSPQSSQHSWVTWALAALVIVLLAVTFAIARTHSPDAEFGGADSNAVTALEEQGVKPWFQPIFEPGSAELESGLFAAQAAFGGAVLGWAVGRLQSRTAIRRLQENKHSALEDVAAGDGD